MRGLFVTGTDTGVGKTILSACLLAAMRAAGEPVRAHKPVVTGLDETHGQWPPDHELLGMAAGIAPNDVAPRRYGPAVSPHLAAELAGERLDADRIVARAREASRQAAAESESARVARQDAAAIVASAREASQQAAAKRDSARAARHEAARSDGALIVEGIGGLLVPLIEDFTVCDLAIALGLPVLIAARPGLGTINHTLLTLQAARHAELDVRAVVLTPWPEQPSAMERSNRETIASLGHVPVAGLPSVDEPDLRQLACAGKQLPWESWLH